MELTREQHVAAARRLRVGQVVRYEPGAHVPSELRSVVGLVGTIWRAPRSGEIRAGVDFESVSMSAPILAGYLVPQ
jgi:hypothetical protein